MASPSGPDDTGKKHKVGRVRHDASGRAIWEWATETGKHAMDSTSRLLKRLDIPGLSLADDAKDKKVTDAAPFGGPKESDPLKGNKGSFNPYDGRSPPKIQAPPPLAKTAPKPPTRPAGSPAAKPPAPLRALSKEEQEAEDPKPGLLGRLFGRKE